MRRWLFKFRQASPALKSLLVLLPPVLLGTRLALQVLPFQRVLHFAKHTTPNETVLRVSDLTPEEIAWAVEAVGRRLLRDKPCLTVALVTTFLFRQHGYSSLLRIGVKASAQDGMEAHAWVERNGKVMVGDLANLASYTALPDPEGFLG